MRTLGLLLSALSTMTAAQDGGGPSPCLTPLLEALILFDRHDLPYPLAPRARGQPLEISPLKFDFEAASREMKDMPNTLRWEDAGPRPGREFLASNEFDWWRMDMDKEPADLLVGFGTNSAWDLAIRKNVKTLVVADWEAQPLFGQHYLFEPLFKVADSPADFLSLLAGVPLPSGLRHAPLEQVFDYIDGYLLTYLRNPAALREERHAFLKQAFDRVSAIPSLSEQQRAAISSYFYATLNNHIVPLDSFGPITGWITDFQQRGIPPIWEFFRDRYHPSVLVADGASPSQVRDPLFSFLSSDEAFGRMKRLMDGNVFYANAPYNKMDVYDSVKKIGDSRGAKDYALSLTNILDCKTQSEFCNRGALKDYLKGAAKRFASPDHPVTIVRSRNTQPPHHFEKFKVDNEWDSASREAKKASSPFRNAGASRGQRPSGTPGVSPPAVKVPP